MWVISVIIFIFFFLLLNLVITTSAYALQRCDSEMHKVICTTFSLKVPYLFTFLFSERELTFTFAICYRRSVCLSSVTFVRPTQAVEIFGNISTALGTLAIR